MKKLASALTALAIFAAVGTADAQTEQVINASIEIQPTLSITVDRNDVVFPVPTVEDFEAGYLTASNGTIVSHLGNVAHNINLEVSAADFMNANGTNTYRKPTSDLSAIANIAATGVNATGEFASYTAFDADAAQLIAGFDAGVYTGDIDLLYRVALSSADVPDTYSTNWTLSIVQQ